jgi:predicted flap endonuclease-1-like 5' DNA nuclease
MLFHTPTQYLVLVLCLVAGWLFGLASSSGGRKWRERHHAEEVEHRRYRDETVAELKARDLRIRELEAERDRALHAAPVATGHTGTLHGGTVHGGALHGGAVPLAATTTGAATPLASDTHRHHEGLGGWFGWGRDNLSRIRGIDEVRERELNDRGIKTFKAIETMTADDEQALEVQLRLAPGTVAREGWREQAAMIREGRDDEHVRRWG